MSEDNAGSVYRERPALLRRGPGRKSGIEGRQEKAVPIPCTNSLTLSLCLSPESARRRTRWILLGARRRSLFSSISSSLQTLTKTAGHPISISRGEGRIDAACRKSHTTTPSIWKVALSKCHCLMWVSCTSTFLLQRCTRYIILYTIHREKSRCK